MGVVLPLKNDDDVKKMTCWERPPRKYDLKGGDKAWVSAFYVEVMMQDLMSKFRCKRKFSLKCLEEVRILLRILLCSFRRPSNSSALILK